MDALITPYGGILKSLLVGPERAAEIRREALTYPSLDLPSPQICQLELLLTGAYSPLTGFMGRADLEAVQGRLTLADGTPWPFPVALTVPESLAAKLVPGQTVALRDAEGFMPAVLQVSEVWPADPDAERARVDASGFPLGPAHPGSWYVAGPVEGLALPPRHDFPELRHTPGELRDQFARRGWRRVLAYQPAQPMHRLHRDFILQTAVAYEANVLIHAGAGSDPVLDHGHIPLVRACQALMPRFPAATSLLALSPGMSQPGGPREVGLSAIVARNYGCGLLAVGGDSRIAGERRRGQDIADLLDDAGRDTSWHRLVAAAGVALIPFPRLVYREETDQYVAPQDCRDAPCRPVLRSEELNRRLTHGIRIPDWASYPEVLAELSRCFPPRSRQGFTVFFTGLSGAGKSTLAKALAVKLVELGGRRVTLLDGDVVRKHLSSELGFSREHRDINIRRIGFVASEITKHGGIAICAPIAPYRNTRADVRAMIAQWGGFIEVHVSTPIDVCERRDRKGLYAKARAGLIPEFTGVSDPYETPETPELAIDTSRNGVDAAVQTIVLKLEHEGYLG
ncbi:MAG: adenylyl-sulfate kinase [Methylococcaceae bacterium]|nr:adenylyl-sulfate kinase [Methylococcaceae bacterium]